MSVTIDLPADVLARLEAEAARHGVGIDEVVAPLVYALPGEHAPEHVERRRPAFVAVGSSTGGTSHRIDKVFAGGFGRN